MYFDVPKFVRSHGCDQGHDEESRNGQYIKIDILDGYILTPERFRKSLGIYRSSGRLPEPPGKYMGLIGPYWKGGRRSKGGGAPPIPIRIGRGAGPPFPSLLPPLPSYYYYSFLPPPSWIRKRRGNLLGVGFSPLWRASPLGRPPPPSLLYIRG